MSRKMAVLVCYNSWYISSPACTNQPREITNFQVFWQQDPLILANFSYFCLELNALVAYSAGASFNTDTE